MVLEKKAEQELIPYPYLACTRDTTYEMVCRAYFCSLVLGHFKQKYFPDEM